MSAAFAVAYEKLSVVAQAAYLRSQSAGDRYPSAECLRFALSKHSIQSKTALRASSFVRKVMQCKASTLSE